MAKILWYGDAISHTGFARVTHSVIEHLSKDNEIVLFAMNYNGDPHGLPYKVYPAAAHNPNDRFGIGRIQSVVQHEKPDIAICLNDIWIVNQVWERIHLLKSQHDFKFIAYFPIDSEWYTSPMLRYVKDFDFSVTFTVEQASRLMAHGVKPKKLGVIPHGLDQKKFYQIDQNEARKQLGLPPDKFIVFNGNRNQPRKNIDQTIKAFAEFAGNKDDVLLYLHMGEKDLGVERGIVNYKHAAELIQELYEDKEYRESVAEQCYEVTQNPSYRWDKIAEGFQKAVEVVK